METESLKALALKVLQGNSSGNFSETAGFQGRKLEGGKSASVSTQGNRENREETAPRLAIKIYSRILDACLWVIQDEADREALKASEGVQGAVYTKDEIHKLYAQKPSPEALRRIHEVKQTFPGAIVLEVKPKTDEARQERAGKAFGERPLDTPALPAKGLFS